MDTEVKWNGEFEGIVSYLEVNHDDVLGTVSPGESKMFVYKLGAADRDEFESAVREAVREAPDGEYTVAFGEADGWLSSYRGVVRLDIDGI